MTARYSIGKAAAFADRLRDRAAWYSGGAWERGRIAVRRTLAQSGLPVTREFLSLGCARGNEASGFFSEFCAVVGALAHYEAHTAIYAGLQVDFADEGLYYEAAAGPNWWEYYFEPVMIGGATEATRRTVPLWQHDTWAENVERQMTRNAAASIVRRHIRLKPAVNDQVNEFWRAHAGDGSVIGVHYRGTDKSEEARRVSYDALAAAVRHTLRGGLAAAKVFLATDEQACVDHMSQAFPDRLITRPVRRSLDGRPVHKRPGDGFRKGEEAVTDCLLLSRGAALVRTASNLGLAAGFFNPAIPVMLVEAGA